MEGLHFINTIGLYVADSRLLDLKKQKPHQKIYYSLDVAKEKNKNVIAIPYTGVEINL